MKEIALLGPTASGKSSLAIEIAKEIGANILSLDSLSIYKEVDIVSAKPTLLEREDIKHFGIDELYIDEYFSANLFFDLYKSAKEESSKEGKHLIITGGTSFYLKALIEGLSPKPLLSKELDDRVKSILYDLRSAYELIEKEDPLYAKKISSNDSYRISKWYEIYLSEGISATKYYKTHQKKAIIEDIDIFEIDIGRDTLRENIKIRTKQMLRNGLIDEVFYLESRYTRKPNPMKAIGIVETLEYLDGKIDLKKLEEMIVIHTVQLAKRQQTFNKTQFLKTTRLLKKDLKNKLLNYF